MLSNSTKIVPNYYQELISMLLNGSEIYLACVLCFIFTSPIKKI